jgi:excisionase family DNA binding protein
MLAERWSCSANHVRKLISAGDLEAFRIGDRLFRIAAETVEQFETPITSQFRSGRSSSE